MQSSTIVTPSQCETFVENEKHQALYNQVSLYLFILWECLLALPPFFHPPQGRPGVVSATNQMRTCKWEYGAT